MTGYIPRWFTRLQTVTHRSTNGAQRVSRTLYHCNVVQRNKFGNETVLGKPKSGVREVTMRHYIIYNGL